MLAIGDDALATLTCSDVVAVPVTHAGRLIAGILAGNKCGPDLELSSSETQLLDAAAGLLGVFHENVARLSEQRAFFFGTLSALTASIDAKDRYTFFGHSANASRSLRHKLQKPLACRARIRSSSITSPASFTMSARSASRKPF